MLICRVMWQSRVFKTSLNLLLISAADSRQSSEMWKATCYLNALYLSYVVEVPAAACAVIPCTCSRVVPGPPYCETDWVHALLKAGLSSFPLGRVDWWWSCGVGVTVKEDGTLPLQKLLLAVKPEPVCHRFLTLYHEVSILSLFSNFAIKHLALPK